MMYATTVDPNQQYPSASRRQALKALFERALPSPGMAMGCASSAPINKLGSGFVRAAISLILLFLVGVATAQAGQLVTFLPPANGYYAKDGRYTATLSLTGSANPRTLKVTSGNVDVTAQFNTGSCAQAPCTITGNLTFGSGVQAGQNYISASVQGKNGSVDSVRQRVHLSARSRRSYGRLSPGEHRGDSTNRQRHHHHDADADDRTEVYVAADRLRSTIAAA